MKTNKTKISKIAILGAGAFGFAMAKVISENPKNKNKEIFLFDMQKEFIEHIQKTRQHLVFHQGIILNEKIKATTDLKEAAENADLIILAIPSKFLRTGAKDFGRYLKNNVILLNLAKGLEAGTNKRVSEILEEELASFNIKQNINYEYCTLSGGMIAGEVIKGSPLCADVACENKSTARKAAKIIQNEKLKIIITNDVIGVELCGALKNVAAVGAGIFDGLGYFESSKSGFISAVSQEMQKLAVSLGADKKTFSSGSQAWWGDLLTTCFGPSRNREFGEHIGKGMNPKEAIEKMQKENKSVEGYITAKVVYELAKQNNLNLPITNSLYNTVYNNKEAKDFVKEFMDN